MNLVIGMMKVAVKQKTQLLKNKIFVIKNLILFFMCIFFSCSEEHVDCNFVEYKIAELPEFNSTGQINSFLEDLYYNDQDIREELDELRLKNPESPKYKSLLDSIHEMSLYNASIINKFYKKYDIQENNRDFSNVALQTPWLILHHTGDLDIRRCHFNNIYKDYCLGNITKNQLYLYVRRTVSIQNRKNNISDKIGGMTLDDLVEYSGMLYDTCNN